MTDESPSRDNEEEMVNAVGQSQIGEQWQMELVRQTAVDESLQALKRVILAGWPDKRSMVPDVTMPYYQFRDELAV